MATKKRIGIGAAAVAAAGLGTFVATGIGDQADRPFGGVEAVSLKAHKVDAPSAGAVAKGAAGGGVRIIFKETSPQPINNGSSVVTIGRCGRGQAAINGYHARVGSDASGVLSEGAAPTLNLRKWRLAIANTNPQASNVIFGLVCVKP